MLKFNKIGKGKLKVLINVYGDFKESINLEKIQEFNNIELYTFSLEQYPIFYKRWNNNFYKNCLGNQQVFKVYETLEKYIAKNDIDIVIFLGDVNLWHYTFLKKIKETTFVCGWSMDDPDASHIVSKDYIKNFDISFCAGVYFNKNKKITEKFIEWGARKSYFIPIGLLWNKWKPIKDFEKQLKSRKYDLIFVGSLFKKKMLSLFKLKKYFGNKMLFFGKSWNGKNDLFWKKIILFFLKWYYNIPFLNKLDKQDFIKIYQNTKIGINFHITYGPSNVRTFELLANGVFEICDNEKGLKELFDVGYEIISFDDINDAIKKIEYYLEHDEERIKIAKAGYEKVINNYRIEQNFKRMFDYIKNDDRFIHLQNKKLGK